MTNEPTDPTFEEANDQPSDTSPPPPPPPSSPPPGRPAGPARLVRDPYTRLGGVASGIAHHFGLDVSLVRIVFILLTLASGFGFLAYIAAWFVIPRAEYWPPAPPATPLRSLRGRDLGLALVGVALLIAITVGGSGSGFILVPVVLIGGGVWLLVQPDAASVPQGTGADSAMPPPPAPTEPAAYVAPSAPVGEPVPPVSKRGRRAAVWGCLTVLLGIIAIPVIAVIALIVALSNGKLDLDFDAESIRFTATSVDDLPYSLDHDAGDVVVDLSDIDPDEFSTVVGDIPTVDIRLDVGDVTVIVPHDVEVDVEAGAAVGSVTVFGTDHDGFRPQIVDTGTSAEAELDIDVDLGAGDITVRRG